MKINWKARFKNPIFIVGKFLPFVLFAVQALLAIINVFYPIGYEITDAMTNEVLRWLNGVAIALLTLSAPIDDTTDGISDSQQALKYSEPKKDVDGRW
ncbi:phage holin [Planococcus beigongshangi]|uniref:phage holin n=1 Tax=Planococcus beigongshangi TaxID=2782536 RepID=UPI00193B7C80|nr:phage holin [Planococcus beigongshangi]